MNEVRRSLRVVCWKDNSWKRSSGMIVALGLFRMETKYWKGHFVSLISDSRTYQYFNETLQANNLPTESRQPRQLYGDQAELRATLRRHSHVQSSLQRFWFVYKLSSQGDNILFKSSLTISHRTQISHNALLFQPHAPHEVHHPRTRFQYNLLNHLGETGRVVDH